ncbi:hypothetical protein [Chitinibacter sp. S2-10]|uniref:hypothetical protein n=1 Tax=Chitinibacter sp. S2-10 TaxID=3373597 RepID=UPI003977C967
MIAPEPYLNAYLLVVHEAVLASRFLASKALHVDAVERALYLEQIADLQDAIHVVVELLNKWEDCDEPALRKIYLKGFDAKWRNQTQPFPISLMTIFQQGLLAKSNDAQTVEKEKIGFWAKFWK